MYFCVSVLYLYTVSVNQALCSMLISAAYIIKQTYRGILPTLFTFRRLLKTLQSELLFVVLSVFKLYSTVPLKRLFFVTASL